MAPIVSSFFPFAYNYAIKLFLDAMEADVFVGYSSVVVPITIFMVAQIVLDSVWRFNEFCAWRSEPFVRQSIITKSYDYVQHHSYKFFQDNFTGTVASKVRGLLSGYDLLWEEIDHGLSQKFSTIIVNLVALAFVNTQLGIFLLGWCLLYIPVMYKLSKRLNALTFEERESEHKIVGQISDRISNILALFSFSARKRELKSLNTQVEDDFVPKQIRVIKYDFKLNVIGSCLYFINYVFVLVYMVHLRSLGDITIGDFALVFGLTLSIGEQVWHATVRMQAVARAMGDFKSALTILSVPHGAPDSPTAKDIKIASPSIAFKDLKFSYDDGRPIFDGLNLDIKAGEKIGLVGHSGAGKSSLINLLLRYFEKDQGQILVDGQDIANVTQDSLRDAIAVIPQDTILFHRTLMENVRFGRQDATDEDVIEACKKAYIHDYVETLPDGYNTHVGERGVKLSGGQRQRVAIARAILKDAPILILDEATSALDSETENLIQQSLHTLIGDDNKTVIAIAHRLSTLKDMDRVIVLDKGKIQEQGTHDQLLAKHGSRYKELWEMQAV